MAVEQLPPDFVEYKTMMGFKSNLVRYLQGVAIGNKG
jgi:hypothetical protein